MDEDNVRLVVISRVACLELPEHKGLGPPQCQHWVLGEGQSGMLASHREGRTVRDAGISHRKGTLPPLQKKASNMLKGRAFWTGLFFMFTLIPDSKHGFCF